MLNKIMKKCLCMLLCILMLVQYTPLMAHATVDQTGAIVADAGVTLQAAGKSTADENAVASVTAEGVTSNYEKLKDALDAASASEGSILTLLKSVSINGKEKIKSGDFTLDLNGYSLTGKATLLEIGEDAALQITDTSADKSGLIQSTNGTAVVNKGKLTLYGGKLSSTGGNNMPAALDNTGTFLMEGGELGLNKSGIYMTSGTATFNGGTISGKVNVHGGTVVIHGGTFTNTAVENYFRNTTVTITGGTFNRLSLDGTSSAEISGGVFNGEAEFGKNGAVLSGGVFKNGIRYNSGTNAFVTKLLAPDHCYVYLDTGAVLEGKDSNVMITKTPCKVVPTKLTVTYVADGVTVDTQTVERGMDAVAPAVPEKTGHTGAWDHDGKNITEHTTIHAVYSANTYNITWVVDGVETVVPETFGNVITKPADPEKDGYSFTGWEGYTDGMTMPAENQTFTALWGGCNHNYDNGFCIYCDAYEPAVWNETFSSYDISNAGQLYWFAAVVNSGYGDVAQDANINGRLVNNITVNAWVLYDDGSLSSEYDSFRPWTPIGSSGVTYAGNYFDGGNFTISGIYFHNEEQSYVGIFGDTSSSTEIENLSVTDSWLCGKDYVGGVVGSSYGWITNCYNSGTVTGDSYVGGITGGNFGGIVTSCVNAGNITGYSGYVGGLVGTNYNEMTDCFNEGAVTGGDIYTGGVVGYNIGRIADCSNEGAVTGSDYVGGVMGNHGNTEATNCFNEGVVTGDNYVGGVVGRNYLYVTECSNKGAVNGGSYVGGVAGENIGIITSCDNGGPVSGIDAKIGGVAGTNSGEIENCSNTEDISGGNEVGGVVGYNNGDKVDNCNNTGDVSGGNSVGGVVGYNGDYIEYCQNSGDVSGSGNYTGGVAGNNSGNITNCVNSGAVTNSYMWIGGVVGYNDRNGVVENCQNSGDVSGDNYVGGVVGQNLPEAEVNTSYNSGVVSGSVYVGGVASHNAGIVTDCYNLASVSGDYKVGGVVGYNVGGTATDSYHAGNITGNSDVGAVVGDNHKGTVANCYYDSDIYAGNAFGANDGTDEDVEGKSTQKFASGEVCYLLNGSTSEGELVWYQTLTEDTYPKFEGDIVYYSKVSDSYTNTEPDDSCLHENTICVDNKDSVTHKVLCADPDCGEIVVEEEKHSYVDAKCACGALQIYVGGVQINADNMHDVLGDGTVSYDEATNTLTLNGAQIKTAALAQSTSAEGIIAVCDLNIVVGEKGAEITGYGMRNSQGICVHGDLNITGGSLNIHDVQIYGIYTNQNDLTITSCNLTVAVNEDGGHALCTGSLGGVITINSGTVTLHGGNTSTGGMYGLATLEAVLGNDVHLIATGGTGASYAAPVLAEGASGKSRTAADAEFVSGIVYNGEYYFEFIGKGVDKCEHQNIIHVDNKDGATHKVLCADPECGETVAEAENHSYVDAKCVCGALQIYVGGVQINADNMNDVLGDGTVSYDEATNTLTLNGAKITCRTVNGSTVVYGISAVCDLNIVVGEKGAEISAVGYRNSDGISVHGDLTITGGSLNIHDVQVYGINTNQNDLTITNCNLTVAVNDDGGHALCTGGVSGMITINSGVVELHGGNTSTGGMYGLATLKAVLGNDVHLIATGGTGASYAAPVLAEGASGKSRTAADAEFVSGIVYNGEYYFEFIGKGIDKCEHENTTPVDNEDGATHKIVCADPDCGETVIEKEAHSEDKAATCVSKAYCSVCDSEYGAVDADAHAWGEPNYTDNCNGTHTASYICANEAAHVKYSEPEDHTYEDGKCVCGAVEPCKHMYQAVVDNHDGATHTLKCRDCEFVYNAAEAHSYNNTGRCACGYQCAHENKSYTDTGYGDHSIDCADCGAWIKYEDHTYDTVTGLCICGAKNPCVHETKSVVNNNDGATHTVKCYDCGHIIDAAEAHSYDATGNCVCGEICAHAFKSIEDNTNGKDHAVFCRDCSAYLGDEEHTLDNRGACACGYQCAHENKSYTDTGYGDHSIDCADCGAWIKYEDHTYDTVTGLCICGAKNPCAHETKSVVNNNDGATHTVKCYDCGHIIDAAEAHSYDATGNCVCGEICAHAFKSIEDNTNGKDHAVFCRDCSAYLGDEEHTLDNRGACACGYQCAHENKSYTDTGYGDHSIDCADCGAWIKYEDHTYDTVTDLCICGAKNPCEHVYHSVVDNHDDATHTRKCRDCGHIIDTAESHSYDTYGACACGSQCSHALVSAEVTYPTCEEDGYITYTCDNCGYSYVAAGDPRHGHNVILMDRKDPTCELNGYEYYACEYCGGKEYTIILEATDHDYEDGTCGNCGEKDPDAVKPNKPVKPFWPIWNWWWGTPCCHHYTEVVTAPTCTEKGYTTHTCTKCGDSYKDSYTNALGHDYEDGICGGCGAEEPVKPNNPCKPCNPYFKWLYLWYRHTCKK